MICVFCQKEIEGHAFETVRGDASCGYSRLGPAHHECADRHNWKLHQEGSRISYGVEYYYPYPRSSP